MPFRYTESLVTVTISLDACACLWNGDSVKQMYMYLLHQPISKQECALALFVWSMHENCIVFFFGKL